MTVRIKNNRLNDYPEQITFPKADSVKRISDNMWEIVCTNVEPEHYTDCVTIMLSDIFGDTGPRILQKNRFTPCNHKLDQSDLFWYTKPQLRLLRNAIYAFNGYLFKSPDLIEFFEKRCAEYGWFGWKEINGETVGYYPFDEHFTGAR